MGFFTFPWELAIGGASPMCTRPVLEQGFEGSPIVTAEDPIGPRCVRRGSRRGAETGGFRFLGGILSGGVALQGPDAESGLRPDQHRPAGQLPEMAEAQVTSNAAPRGVLAAPAASL